MAPSFTRTVRRSAAVTHGAALTFETLHADPAPAPLRVHRAEDTLLRVVAGDVELSIAGSARVLATGDEAIVPAGAAHRLTSVSAEARILVGFRKR